MINLNIKAFLDTIAFSEGTKGIGFDGYNMIVGGELFSDYSTHPNKKVWIKRIGQYSTAAGRYQILNRNWEFYKLKLSLVDFSPQSQDEIAIQLIKECGAYKDIIDGNISVAIKKCCHIWASLPGAGYGQRENKEEKLTEVYLECGGTICQA